MEKEKEQCVGIFFWCSTHIRKSVCEVRQDGGMNSVFIEHHQTSKAPEKNRKRKMPSNSEVLFVLSKNGGPL